MADTTIYGSSDDLIEFEGAIRDELGCYDQRLARHGLDDLADMLGIGSPSERVAA